MEGISLISTYTPNTPSEIKEWTFIQYKTMLDKVQMKLSFQIKTSAISGGYKFTEEDYPCKTESLVKQDRVYLSDMDRLLSAMSGG